MLAEVRAALAEVADFDEAAVREALEAVRRAPTRSSRARSTSRCAWRSAGTTVSPGIFESVALLGREETLARIDAALACGESGREGNQVPAHPGLPSPE